MLRFPVLVLSLLAASAAVPAGAALPPADEQAVRQVILTDALLDTLIAIKAEGQALGIGESQADASVLVSLDAMARSATRDARVAPLFARHGLSPRDYVTAAVALMRAGMAAQLGTSAAANGTTAANIAFAKSRMSRIAPIFGNEGDEDGDEYQSDE
ncbi:MAG: hypothetical protein AB7E60_04520 [Sphingobium sp.]